jgi:hypothetical protein
VLESSGRLTGGVTLSWLGSDAGEALLKLGLTWNEPLLIEASSDLQTWVPVQTFSPGAANGEVTIPIPHSPEIPRQFYRARAAP